MGAPGGELSYLAERFEDLGAGSLLYTNVDVEGLQQGIALAPVEDLLRRVGVPVVVSGGIANAEDVRALRDAGAAGAVRARPSMPERSGSRISWRQHMRTSEIHRATKETDISLSLNLDGTGLGPSRRGYRSLTIC